MKVVRKLPDIARGKAPFSRPHTVVKSESFESAVHGADTYAGRHFTRAFIISRGPGAGWRDKPASTAQVDYLNKFREEHEQLDYEGVTKGKANDMITKIKFGARGRFRQLGVEKRKQEKAHKQRHELERLRDNETVRVGPLSDH